MERFDRTKNLIGEEGLEKLKNSRVAIFGIGGVGGFVVESLIRSGIGGVDLYDFDVVSKTNINRQIIALERTIGNKKVDVMKQRLKQINPNANVRIFDFNVNKESIDQIDFSDIDFVVDAIDTITSKVLIIQKAKQQGVGIISCMGTGNKFDASQLEIVDIEKTSMCPLAKVMRKLLKNNGISGVKVIYSKEKPISATIDGENGKHIPSSAIFVPSVAGIMIAEYVFKKLLEK